MKTILSTLVCAGCVLVSVLTVTHTIEMTQASDKVLEQLRSNK